jgi:hypothetical protein
MLTATLPAVAIPMPSNTVALKAAVADDVTLAQSTWSARQRHAWPGNYAAGAGVTQLDTVGSLGYDGRGYGYNRFSGQVYQSCVDWAMAASAHATRAVTKLVGSGRAPLISVTP